jgi:arylsulfatase A-like enzyme
VHTPIQAKEEIINDYLDKEGVGCHNDATYAAMIKSVDESVGRVFSALEDHQLSDNTLVIFVSDNGGYGPRTCMQPLEAQKACTTKEASGYLCLLIGREELLQGPKAMCL